MKKMNKKGFTLAELLIVVAIIAVLVAIAIPIFTNQLEKSKEATDIANVRAAYAEVVTQYLAENKATAIEITARQGIADWQGTSGALVVQSGGVQTESKFNAVTSGGVYKVEINESGVLTVSPAA